MGMYDILTVLMDREEKNLEFSQVSVQPGEVAREPARQGEKRTAWNYSKHRYSSMWHQQTSEMIGVSLTPNRIRGGN